MNISGISDRSLLGRVLRNSLKLIPSGAIVPILQGRLRGKKWIVGSCNHGCWLGCFENEKRILFEKMVTEGSVVFDIGAHVGFYSLLAAILVGQKGRVLSFEPNPRNLVYLKKHIQLNKVNNISVIEAAISDREGYAYFTDKGHDSSSGHISLEGNLHVKTESLDNLYLIGKIPAPDYLKIDVEGAEMLVLSGARSILSDCFPTIFLATHGEAVHNQCIKFLRSLDYKLKSITGVDIKYSDELLCYKKND